MNLIWILGLSLTFVISSYCEEDEISESELRKYLGFAYYDKCKQYVKMFKCMTGCKSLGYKVFRLDFRCKCSCFEQRTTTILPFFQWRTTGTTRKMPVTRRPKIYEGQYNFKEETLPPDSEEESATESETGNGSTGGGTDSTGGGGGGDSNTTPSDGDGTTGGGGGGGGGGGAGGGGGGGDGGGGGGGDGGGGGGGGGEGGGDDAGGGD